MNVSAPFDNTDDTKYDRCQIFDIDFTNVGVGDRPSEETKTIPCTEWEYDTTNFDVSILLFLTPSAA